MKLHQFATLAVLTLATVALAEAPSAGAAVGRGMARNQEERRVRFDFEVVKRPQAEPRGRTLFEAVNAQGQVTDSIRLIRVREFGADGNLARWNGRAVFRTRVDGQERAVEGTVRVQVNDRKPRGNSDPNAPRDVLRFEFRSDNGQVQFTYEGLVVDGDLGVRAPERGNG
jgi:hypothetical protein